MSQKFIPLTHVCAYLYIRFSRFNFLRRTFICSLEITGYLSTTTTCCHGFVPDDTKQGYLLPVIVRICTVANLGSTLFRDW